MKHIVKWFALAFVFTGCAHESLVSVQGSSTVVAEILDQVNLAVQEAKTNQGTDGPEISSVQVDLQLGASTGANASFPLGLVFPLAQASQDDLHRVSLTFTPKPASVSTSGSRPDHTLVLAIEEIYRSVANANPNYQFQRGTMQLQCTLQTAVGLSNTASGARTGSRGPSANESSLVLVPIQVGATTTRQSIQTVILTFSPREAKAVTPTPSVANP